MSVCCWYNIALNACTHTHTHTHTQGFEGPTEDSVVPCTPVLNEVKQLGMTNRGQTIPSTPSERPSHTVPQIGSSLTTDSLHASGGLWDNLYQGLHAVTVRHF